MNFLSVCSGIEAASVAWNPLGWKAWGVAEIDKFPSAVLAHHYPDTPNLGDMTAFKDWPDGSIDLLCGGTPCQSFSNAGLREGLDDPRGQLMLTFGAIAARYRPRWLVWENVPGVLSSNEGRDFGSFLGLLGLLGYGFAYRVLDAQYVRVDGYGRAVPQRRNRVFVVGCLGDWRSAAAVLLERESLRGDLAPRREAGARVAATLTRGAESSGKGGYAGRRQEDDVNIVADTLRGHIRPGSNTTGAIALCPGYNADSELIAFDTTQITSAANRNNPQPGDPCHPLAAGAHPPAIAFNARQDPINGPINGPIDCDGGSNGVLVPSASVRRLMPVECERLMGFPDGYTAITYRGKPAADGPRYKALGNSWAVNCARWIGRRIAIVDSIHAERAA
jgi:DNA (cytosine-5)-methyltransferase 1